MNTSNPAPGKDTGMPSDRMMTAISIVQSHILADDSLLDGAKIWGPNFMRAPALEAAVDIMINLLSEMDPLDALAAKDKVEEK